MKKKILCTGLLFVSLFLFLELSNKFHFFFIEQFQLFQYTTGYFDEVVLRLGGLGEYCSNFLVQFFILPYVGAFFVSLLLTGVFLLIYEILKSIGIPIFCFLPAFLPVFFLLFCHFDQNYYLGGTLAFFLLVLLFYVFRKINYFFLRIIFAVLGVSLLFIAFFPEFYYQSSGIRSRFLIYLPWILFPILLLLSPFFKKIKLTNRKMIIVVCSIQVVIIAFGLFWGLKTFGDRKSYVMKELDYYSRTEQWDKIIREIDRTKTRNYLFMNYLNLALVQKGKLPDKLFNYDQNSTSALVIPWNKTNIISTLLSDITFCAGDIASSRQYAYETIVLSDHKNGRMLKRLIQTELIYGEYRVAEKCINILKNTLFYRQWAEEQCRFLNNDVACDSDPLIGYKKKCLPSLNENKLVDNFFDELTHLIKSNPQNKQAAQYLGACFLLSKDLESFDALVNLLIKNRALPVMPEAYQEALLALFEQQPEEWNRLGITQNTNERYQRYKSLLKSNIQNPDLKGYMQSQFGNTYWFYLQFK